MKLYITLFILFISSPIFSQSKIKQVKKNVKEVKDNPSNPSEIDSYDIAADIMSELIKSLLTASTSGISDESQTFIPPYKTQRYPYFDGVNGKYNKDVLEPNFTTINLELNYYRESKSISGFNGLFQINFSPKFSLHVRGNLLKEKINDQVESLDTFHFTPNLHLTDASIDFWVGGGLTTLTLDQLYTGYNFNLGLELFIAKPVSIYTSWYFGKVEKDIKFGEGHIDLKVYIKNFYSKVGYQTSSITDVKFNGVSFGLGVILF